MTQINQSSTSSFSMVVRVETSLDEVGAEKDYIR